MCMHICALIVSLSSDALACNAVSLMRMRVCVHMYAYAYVIAKYVEYCLKPEIAKYVEYKRSQSTLNTV